jgi:hypothetical protein
MARARFVGGAVRRGPLGESLERFAERAGTTPYAARLAWRLVRADALGIDPGAVAEDGPRIAPGVAVPTRNPWIDTLEPGAP